MSPRQAKSEVLGRRKRGAKIVIGDSEDFPAGETNMEVDALGVKLSIISGRERAQVLIRGKTSRGERLLTCVTFPRAWRRNVSPRQAKSEVLGRHKEGAKIVIGDSEDFPAGETNMVVDALGVELFIISDRVRAQVLIRGKTSGRERLLTCVTVLRAWRSPPLFL